MKKIKSFYLFFLFVLIGFVYLFPSTETYGATLEKKYRNKNVTSVKNQGSEGLCWSFAAISAMEAELIQNNKASKKIDLSELQLAYFAANETEDELGQSLHIQMSDRLYLDGNTQEHVIITLKHGLTISTEERYPYSSANLNLKLTAEDKFSGEYILNKAISVSTDNRTEVKKAIKKYGAVTMDFCGGSYNNMNSDTFAIYNPNNEVADHSVCVVGWDDTFSKKNFLVQPKTDGAWIVKNSWGSDWGDNGYCYLSYCDTSITLFSFAYDMEKTPKNKNHVYYNSAGTCPTIYYEADGKTTVGNTIKGDDAYANVFVAHGNLDGGEKLISISFGTVVSCSYEIEIYTDLKTNTDPTSGVKAQTIKGDYKFPMNTDYFSAHNVDVPLKKPIYLTEGEMFSIVVSLKDENGNSVGIGASQAIDNNLSVSGESYGKYKEYYTEKIKWSDVAKAYGQNVDICAYTVDCKKDSSKDKKSVLGIKEQNKEKDKDSVLVPTVKNLKVSSVGVDSAVLTWKKDDSLEYFIYQMAGSTGYYRRVDSTTSNSYTITGLSAQTKYSYAVKGYRKASGISTTAVCNMTSDYFASVDFTTKDGVNAPTVKVKSGKITLKWNKMKGANKYKIMYFGIDSDYEWEEIGSVKKLSYTYSKAVKGVEGMYRVYGYNGNKLVGKSAPVKVTLK